MRCGAVLFFKKFMFNAYLLEGSSSVFDLVEIFLEYLVYQNSSFYNQEFVKRISRSPVQQDVQKDESRSHSRIILGWACKNRK